MTLAKKSFSRLDRAAMYMVKNISETASAFKPDEFKRLTEKNQATVEATSVATISHLKKLITWFHWKNLGVISAVTLGISILTGFYITDEMPWEMHQQIAVERNAGKALYKAWPNLSTEEKQHILQYADHTNI